MTLEEFARHGMTLLVDSSLKSVILLSATGLALLLLRRSSAAMRHLVLLLALVGLLSLPLFSGFLPRWRVAIWPTATTSAAQPANALSDAPAPAVASAPPTPSAAPSSANLPTIAPPAAMPVRPAHPPFSWPLVCLGVWALGVGIALASLLAGVACVQRIGRMSGPVESTAVNAIAHSLLLQLGIRRKVSLRQGAENDLSTMPMTWGWRHPFVLLPANSAEWSEERLRVVLLHEFAHVVRSDWLWQMLAHLACAAYWYHPGVWLVARQLRIESERACDDQVLAAGVPATDYARNLVEVARSLSRAQAMPRGALPMAATSQIGDRIAAILQSERMRKMVTRKNILITAFFAASICVPLATLRLVARAQAPRELIMQAGNTDPAAVKVLSQMTAAYKALKTYSGEEAAEGSGALGMPYHLSLFYERRGKLAAVYTRAFDQQQTISRHLILDGKTLFATSSDDVPGRYARITKPQTNYSLWEEALVIRCDIKFPIVMYLLEDNRSFMKDIESDSNRVISLGKPERLDGVTVDTVVLKKSNGSSIMQIGHNDHLLRRVTQIMGPEQNQAQMKTTQTFTKVRANPALPASEFVFTPPPGAVAVDVDPGGTHADPAAVALVARMYAASVALKSFSCKCESTWETMRAGKLHVAHLGHATFAIQKPYRVALTRTGQTGSATAVSDGRNLYVTTTEGARYPMPPVSGRYLKLPIRQDDWNINLTLSRFGGLPEYGDSFDFMPNVVLGAVTMPADSYDWKMGKPGVVNGEPVDKVTLLWGNGVSKYYNLMTLAISRRDHLLRQVSEASDARHPRSCNVETYTNVKINPDLPRSLFVFTPPPGSSPVAMVGDLYAKR